MSSPRNWFKLAAKLSLVAAVLLVPSRAAVQAQTNLGDQPRYTPQQWEELQEFARQFRDDPSLLPPADSVESRPQSVRRTQVPARGASFRVPRQDEPTQEPEVFDPFKELRSDDKQQPDPDADFDPSPDPPQEAPNQTQQPQGGDQGDPFSDDRAVDRLKELEQKAPQVQPRITPNPRAPRQWQPLPTQKPVDESAIQQWELPPGSVTPGDTQNYGADSANQNPTPQPQSNVAPYPYSPEFSQPPVPSSQTQPNHSGFPNSAPPYRDQRQSGSPSNYYQPGNSYGDPTYADPSQQGYAGHPQAGQQNYFANPRQQWGVAGVEPCYDCNSCGVRGCDFDSDAPEFYLSGFGMAVDLRNLNSANGTLLADNGGGFGLAMGQRQGRNLRTELEYAWRSNSIIGFEDANNSFDVTGKIKSQAGMANAYWEFVNFPGQSIKPYVGAGLGFARLDADLQDNLGSLTPERSKDSSFAYQFMGGINYQPTSYVDLFIEYRLFRTDSFQIDTNSGFAADRYDYEANNLVGGIRWKF